MEAFDWTSSVDVKNCVQSSATLMSHHILHKIRHTTTSSKSSCSYCTRFLGQISDLSAQVEDLRYVRSGFTTCCGAAS